MDISEPSKAAIKKALDENWKIQKLDTFPGIPHIYALTSPWGFRTIRLGSDYAIFETFICGHEVDGNFGEFYMEAKIRYGARAAQDAIKYTAKVSDWITRKFL